VSLQAPPALTPEIGDFVQLVNAAWHYSGRPPVRLTSWWRTRSQNASVAGHPNSQHLTGLAIDLLPDDAGQRFAQLARMVGLVVVDEGDHFHVQRYAAGASRGLCCGLAVSQVR
jgi:hypothetical protein